MYLYLFSVIFLIVITWRGSVNMFPSTKRILVVVVAVFIATLLAMLAIGGAVVNDYKGKTTVVGYQAIERVAVDVVRQAQHLVGVSHTSSSSHHDASDGSHSNGDAVASPPALSSAHASFGEFTFEGRHPYSRSVWEALKKARQVPANKVVPMVITPMFHDGDVLPRMLESINVPVRHFHFTWNSNDNDIREIVEELKRLPFGVSFAHNPNNFGFSASINLGLKQGLAMTKEDCPWYWVINCDVTFPPETMPEMVRRVYETDLTKVGMMYGPAIDHYAFVVTRPAVETAGLMDENFYPAYFEDVDWRWRINLAGFEEIVFHLPVNHIRSHNLKKGADPQFLQMHSRHGNGWPYGGMKWGEIRQHLIHERYPPSGWKTPFGIDMPLDMWVIDEDRMACIKTGSGGPMHPRTGNCWYNGYKTLAPHLKNGTWFPECMKNPYPDAFQPR